MATTNPIVSLATISVLSSLTAFATDGAYVANKGSAAAEGDAYVNTTEHAIRAYQNGAWHFVKTAVMLSYATEAAFVTGKDSAAANGDFFYDSTTNEPKIYRNSAWRSYRPAGWRATVAKSANYTLTLDDDVVVCTGTPTITLPAASTAEGKEYTIINSGGGAVNIGTSSGDTINGASSTHSQIQYETVGIVCVNAAWYRVG